MIEVDFKDRIPTHAGRVKLTPVSGQPDTFIIKRADEPIEEGTPLDKATIDSIIKSRMTGRYYLPTVTSTILSNQTGLTVNPIPTNTWSYITTTSGRANSWTVTSSSTTGVSYPWNVLDGNANTSWKSVTGPTHTWQISSGTPIALKKFKVRFTEGNMAAELQASNDGIIWQHITHLSSAGSLVDYSVVNPTAYNHYRVLFTASALSYAAELNEFIITEYDITTAQNDYVIEKFPETITDHQRFAIVTPDTVNTSGVVKNTLNGRNIDVVLQPNKRYELVSSWNGNYYAREM